MSTPRLPEIEWECVLCGRAYGDLECRCWDTDTRPPKREPAPDSKPEPGGPA